MINFDDVLLSIAVLAGLGVVVFWAAMVVHCFRNRDLPKENRILWLVVVVFGKLAGAGAYYVLKYRRRSSTSALC